MSEASPDRTPQSVCIAGALLIVAGVGAVIHIVSSILQGGLWLNIAFFGIPIGYGLLAGAPSSRLWALVMSGGGLVMFLLIGSWFLLAGPAYPEDLSAAELVYGIVSTILAFGGCAFVFFVLLRSETRSWFQIPRDAPADGRRWASPVLLVATFFLVWQALDEWQVARTFDDLFPIHVNVVPYNAETGEPVRNLSWEKENHHQGIMNPDSLPKLSAGTYSTGEGLRMRVQGVADRPVTILIRSDGFEEASLELTPQMEVEQRLPMRPVE